MRLKTYGVLAAAMFGLYAYGATNYPAPDIVTVSDPTYGGALEKLSNNGQWAVGWGKSVITDGAYSFPRLYNVQTNDVKYLFTASEAEKIAEMYAKDVTDDGSIVVGCFNSQPAIWRASTGKWTTLSHKHAYKANGRVDCITPDGKYAIGTVTNGDYMQSTIRVWDLSGSTPVDITPDNLPIPYDLSGELGFAGVKQLYATDISDDGTKFIGLVDFSIAGYEWSFIYDMNTKTWQGLGVDVIVKSDGTYEFRQPVDGLRSVTSGAFIPGTNTVAGATYGTDDNVGVYYYDLETGDITIVPDASGYEFGAADSFGTIYASKSYEGPMRDWYFKTGNYWYDFSSLLKQLWDINWEEKYSQDGIGFTGTFTNVSKDAKTLLVSDFSMTKYKTYVIKLDAPLKDIAVDFNLLGNYSVAPVSNASFANLKEVKVTFDRDIKVLGSYNAVQLLDEKGSVVANSISLAADPANSKCVVATFRNRRLEEGKVYTVAFPKGIVSVTDDDKRTNDEIRVTYKGRPDAPVAPVTISPAEGSDVARINANSNPVSVRFNSEIAVLDGSGMKLYLVSDNVREEIASLSGSITGDILSVYPLLEQRLAYGSKYEIVIPAGTVADISGADPNEEIVIHYNGNFVPEVPGENGILFEDDFSEGLTNKWMFYDGASDLEPSELMESWGFKKGYPWWTVMEDEMSTDQSAATHSMFKNPGKADSWMVTTLLNIKDDSASINFKSQSYRASGDRLKVYVYATDDVYTALTPTIVDNFRYYGKLVYDEEQTPGASEELLTGDWKENSISLADYAGKNVYVAFVNDNRNKSAIFLDDVMISMDVRFAFSNLTPEYVVKQDEVEVKGLLQVVSQTETFKGYSIKLLDADNNVISEISEPNVTASKGWRLEFTMPDKLKTPVGKEVKYKLSVTMGDVTEVYDATLRNLARQTTKRVVIEEMTGQGCQACPLGHAAIDWILKDFPDMVYPIELHTFTGDPLNNAPVQNLCTSLGLNAAPTARINRNPDIVSPMDGDAAGKYVYKNAGVWYDYVVSELETFAPADMDITSVVYDGTNYVADVKVTYALDMPNQNHNILIELCEDEVQGIQYNPRYEVEDPALGEWGKGGIYGQLNVPYSYHNVLRNWSGTTFNGTGGLIPNNIEAGKDYEFQLSLKGPRSIADVNKTHVTVMLIDSETGRVLNAYRRFTNTSGSGISDVEDSILRVFVSGNEIKVADKGEIEVEVYSLQGVKVAGAKGYDSVNFNVEGYTGMAIVMVKSASGVKTVKAIIR